MRVGFDAHMIGQHETGNETYALGLLAGLQSVRFPVDCYAFRPPPSTLHRFHRMLPRQSYLRIPFTTPVVAARDNLDLFHATYVLPPWLPCVSVVTVHDITYALFPEWFDANTRAILNALVPAALHQARRIITISEHTRQDLIRHYRLPPEKVSAIHLAPRPDFGLPMREPPTREGFLLYVGNVEPRKNVETVIRAVAVLRDRKRPVRLLIAGKQGLHGDATRQLVESMNLSHLVTFTGYVTDERLRNLYASCTALVHPALYEGFGLTPLEAMVQGTPVIGANTSSLPEVVGDAALLVPAENVEAWTEAIEQIMGSTSLQRLLSDRGRQRVACYSWSRCAEKTIGVYREALQ